MSQTTTSQTVDDQSLEQQQISEEKQTLEQQQQQQQQQQTLEQQQQQQIVESFLKQCKKCHLVKDFNQFNKDYKRNYYNSYCKTCSNERALQHHRTHYVKKQRKPTYKFNPEIKNKITQGLKMYEVCALFNISMPTLRAYRQKGLLA